MSGERSLAQPRAWSRNLPASGAWQPGDPSGPRSFHNLTATRPFALEGGGLLTNADIAYETWGELNEAGDNGVLICHALTGDAHAAGEVTQHQPDGGWWNDLIGPGKAIDTDRWFVVCSNVLGGCQGSTGPASIDPVSGARYAMQFPTVTIRDMVRAQAHMSTQLGVDVWHSVVGGSMGGMQALEWALMFPDRLRSVATVASAAAASPWQISWSAMGRLAIALDPKWQGGNYYDAGDGEGPHAGLSLARGIANITYRSDPIYAQRFGRACVDPSQIFDLWERFQVESYLDHHGDKLTRRFDANSYLILNKAMDLHDVSRGRGSFERAMQALRVPLLAMSVTSDNLYQPRLQSELADLARAAGIPVTYELIESEQGHDGFLIETDVVGAALLKFFDSVDDLGT